MALSREEARDIGKEAADRVIKSAQACRCGIEMWHTRTNVAALEAIILHQQPTWVEPVSQLMRDTLTYTEQGCSVDMAKAKELAVRIKHDIEREDWGEARVDLALMTGAILGPFEACAEEGSNPGGQHVTIEDPGKTTFKPGEVISKETFDKENERVRKLSEKPATGVSTGAELAPPGGEYRLGIGKPARAHSPIIHEATTVNPDPAEMMPIEVDSAFPEGDTSTFNPQEKAQIDRFINEVPDKNDTRDINYWLDWGDRKVYLEGWIDKCLVGTGFPPMEGGEWDKKIQYMVRDTHRTLIAKQVDGSLSPPEIVAQLPLTLIEGGFREFEAGEKNWLYGVTWGVYKKAE